MLELTRQQVLAFRLSRQFLSERAAPEQLLQVASPGIQNTPPGSALLAIGARLDNFTSAELSQALHQRKNLIQLWSLRSAPYIFPVSSAPTFTIGLLPDDETSALHFMRGATAHLNRFNLSATKAIELTVDALQEVLADGSELTKDELGVRLAERVAQSLPLNRRQQWDEPDGLRENTYGQSIVRYALSVVSLLGIICFGQQHGTRAARFTLTENWLGASLPKTDRVLARADLVRHYLRYFGPGELQGFITWSGVSPEYAKTSWSYIADELVSIFVHRRKRWLLASDLDFIQDAPMPGGVRLLPPHDPYLSTPDKILLEPDKALHQRIWRRVGSPGVVLIDGEISGVWHPQKRAGTLSLQIELFTSIDKVVREQIQEAAEQIALLRQARLLSVNYNIFDGIDELVD